MVLRFAAILVALLCLQSPALAHQSSYTYATMSTSKSGKVVRFEIRLSSKDLFEALQLGEDRDASDKEILAGSEQLKTYVLERVYMSVPGQECALGTASVHVVKDGQRFAQVKTRLRCPSRIASVELSYHLFFDLDERHEGLLRIGDGLVQFTNKNRRHEHVWGNAAIENRLGFLRSGALHVLYGLDHILFLISLLMVIGLRQNGKMLRGRTVKESLRAAAGIVTAFTLGHSLTLVMAAVGWVSLPSRFVESMIAASIVFVAVENLLRPDPPNRSAVALLFGLMHGLGFASMLRPLLPAEDVVVPLLIFNLGVELGQLAVVAMTLPILWGLIRILGARRYRRTILPVSSAVLAVAGLLWFAERALAL